jgi:hypothetical protein
MIVLLVGVSAVCQLFQQISNIVAATKNIAEVIKGE